VLVEFASAQEHLITYGSNARGANLTMTRLSMQVNSIVEIR